MSAGHTPGPWVHHPDYNIISTRDGRMLFEWQARSQSVGMGERDANARLIATAPELLDALEAMLEQLSKGPYAFKDSDALRSARAAVKKATGETPC